MKEFPQVYLVMVWKSQAPLDLINLIVLHLIAWIFNDSANSRKLSLRQRNRQQSIVAMETGFRLEDAMYWFREGFEVRVQVL